MLRRKRIDSSIFTARPVALGNLENKLKQRLKRSSLRHAVLVHGMGGTGKTQLVLQYVEKHKHEYNMVIWIDAASPESFVVSCIRASKALRLTDDRYRASMRQTLVPQRSPTVCDFLDWLEDRPQSENWLLILDGVDDVTWGIKDVLPRGPAGNLIVTSRDSYTARSLGCVSFSLESMEMEEAKRFLQAAAFPDLDETSVELDNLCSRVASLLDCLPLAVHLAAATIQTDPSIVSLDEIDVHDACKAVEFYIERFEDNKDHLLLRDDYQFMQSTYPRTILTTFETTFQKLHGEDRPRWEPPALRLLTLLAFLGDAEAVNLHKRCQQAYSGIRSGDDALNAYAASNLPKWLSKMLTGESSVDFACLHQTSWDHRGYCETLNILERYGLVRPHSGGFPQVLPLHKIVRWRVQKEGEEEIRVYLRDYTVMLELALSSQKGNLGETLYILSELADQYRNLGQWQYAEECATAHLRRQIHLYGYCHASTVGSLVRLIEILGELQLPDHAEREIFCFVKDADDRQAVLEVLPADLLLLLDSVFLRQPKTGHRANTSPGNGQRAHTIDSGISNSPPSMIGAGQALQKTSWATGHIAEFQPTSDAPGLQEQLKAQLIQRKQVLKKAAGKKPDLVTLFEVLSMGAGDLTSDYMQHIDSDTVRYRDPVGARTVLHFVAAYGGSRDVQQCIQNGSDVHARDRYGATPLHVAGMCGRPEVFRALIEANGNTDLKDYNGRTAIEYAWRRQDIFTISPSPGQRTPTPSYHETQRSMLDKSSHETAPEPIFHEMPSDSSRHAYVEDYDDDSDDDRSSISWKSLAEATSHSDGDQSRRADSQKDVEIPHNTYFQPDKPPRPRSESTEYHDGMLASSASKINTPQSDNSVPVSQQYESQTCGSSDCGTVDQCRSTIRSRPILPRQETLDHPRPGTAHTYHEAIELVKSLDPPTKNAGDPTSPSLESVVNLSSTSHDLQTQAADALQVRPQTYSSLCDDPDGDEFSSSSMALVLWQDPSKAAARFGEEAQNSSAPSQVGDHPWRESMEHLRPSDAKATSDQPPQDHEKYLESDTDEMVPNERQSTILEQDLPPMEIQSPPKGPQQSAKQHIDRNECREQTHPGFEPQSETNSTNTATQLTRKSKSPDSHGQAQRRRRRHHESSLQLRHEPSDQSSRYLSHSYVEAPECSPMKQSEASKSTHARQSERVRKQTKRPQRYETVTPTRGWRRAKQENSSVFRSFWRILTGRPGMDERKRRR